MSKKNELPKLPKKLFVYWSNTRGGDEPYLLCYETERECADLEEDRKVGVYELIETGVIKVQVIREAK